MHIKKKKKYISPTFSVVVIKTQILTVSSAEGHEFRIYNEKFNESVDFLSPEDDWQL